MTTSETTLSHCSDWDFKGVGGAVDATDAGSDFFDFGGIVACDREVVVQHEAWGGSLPRGVLAWAVASIDTKLQESRLASGAMCVQLWTPFGVAWGRQELRQSFHLLLMPDPLGITDFNPSDAKSQHNPLHHYIRI